MIREARRKFGGKFYNDWHGWNRYTPIPPETHTPAERGIISIYNFLELKLAAIPTVLPKPYIVAPEGNKNLATLLREIDPSTYLYNAMLPYAIAAIEYFFSQVFIVMIRYDARAQSKIAKENRRIYMEDVLGISRGEKTIEDLVAGWYSFQSLDGIHRAFADWLDIDFWAMMRKRKRIRNRTIILSDALRELIKMRHELIHRFEFDYELDRERLIYIFGVVEEVIKTFLRELEASHGMRLSDEINV